MGASIKGKRSDNIGRIKLLQKVQLLTRMVMNEANVEGMELVCKKCT